MVTKTMMFGHYVSHFGTKNEGHISRSVITFPLILCLCLLV